VITYLFWSPISISSMKKQSVSRTVVSCAHNILIPNHLFSLLLISAASFAEKQHLSFLVIGLSREGPESTIYCRLIKLKLYGYSWIKYWIYISCCSKQRNGCNYMHRRELYHLKSNDCFMKVQTTDKRSEVGLNM
jgi:hypothetical protein